MCSTGGPEGYRKRLQSFYLHRETLAWTFQAFSLIFFFWSAAQQQMRTGMFFYTPGTFWVTAPLLLAAEETPQAKTGSEGRGQVEFFFCRELAKVCRLRPKSYAPVSALETSALECSKLIVRCTNLTWVRVSQMLFFRFMEVTKVGHFFYLAEWSSRSSNNRRVGGSNPPPFQSLCPWAGHFTHLVSFEWV